MADIQFGLMMRAQFPQGDDMQVRFREMLEQARLADELGYACITNGMHYSSAPWQDFQQFPFLCRMMAEAPNMRLNFGLILLSLHKPLDLAEQIATADIMSGGKVIFGVALGYREVEFLAFGTTQRERVKRFEENLEAIKRLWTEDVVDMAGSHFTLQGASAPTKPLQKPHPPIWIGGGSQPFEKVYGQTVTNIDPVLKRIAKYAKTWVPHSSATADMVTRDWDKIQRFMAEFGRKPGEMTKVYSNFVYVLKKGEKPEVAAPHFKVYSGMDLPYWKEFYLLGEAEEVAERVRGKVAALGGCEHVVLNPLNWGMEQLELLAGEVLPRVAKP